MSNKQFISNLSATYADVRRLDAKNINLKGKNILEYIKENTPIIVHSKDTREFIYNGDLWGQWVGTDDDGAIVIHDDWVTNPNSDLGLVWIENVKAVQDNKAYSEITTDSDSNFTGVVEDSIIANIQTERIKNGSFMFFFTPLNSFNGDLSSLVNGEAMFSNCDKLTSFSSDLSSLVNGENMFCNTTALTSFSSDLSSLTNSYTMFKNTSLTSFNSNLSSLVNGNRMFEGCSALTSFNSNLSSLVNGGGMFSSSSITSFNSDLSSLVNGESMFSFTPLILFSSDLSSLVNGESMFSNCDELTSFSGDLSNLVNGEGMFSFTSLIPQSVMYIVESIKNIKEEKAKYTNGKIPWVTYDSTTGKYSSPFGFMENGDYVCFMENAGYIIEDSLSSIIHSSKVGKLTLGIDVANNPETIVQQLKTFAEGCLYTSWEKLKEAFVNKGWTVTFQYKGTSTDITLSEDEQFRGVPVYARLIEVSDKDKDKAKYCTEDGTKFYNIDWGHDVTNYDSYQHFGSLLEACGYFGVIPVKYLEEK